jgi:hypothetical protein
MKYLLQKFHASRRNDEIITVYVNEEPVLLGLLTRPTKGVEDQRFQGKSKTVAHRGEFSELLVRPIRVL